MGLKMWLPETEKDKTPIPSNTLWMLFKDALKHIERVYSPLIWDSGIMDTPEYQKAMDKTAAFDDILQKRQLSAKEAVYIGDELVDIPLLRRVGFAVAVKDAVDDVKRHVDYVTVKNGGYGAVREVCELILKTQGKWDEVTAKYFI